MTTVNGLELLPIEDKKTLLKALKNAVAGGGSISDSGGLEVQGEHAETVVKILKAQGFTQVLDISEGMLGRPGAPGWLARNLPTEPCLTC